MGYRACPYITHLKRIYHITCRLTGTGMHIGLLVCNTLFQILGKLPSHSTCTYMYVYIKHIHKKKTFVGNICRHWFLIFYDFIYTNEIMYCLTGNGKAFETSNKM